MKISKRHQRFADYLKNQEALTNPEKFLGPNYKTVLNFWNYIETLNDDQLNVVDARYWALNEEERSVAWNVAREAANDVVGNKARFDAWCASLSITVGNATYELIGMHILLNSGKTLKFIPLFDSHIFMASLNICGGSVEQFGMETLLNSAKDPKYNWIVRTTQLSGAVRAGYVNTLAKDCVKVQHSSLPDTSYYKKHLAAAITFMTKTLKVSGGIASLTSIQSVQDGFLFVFE